MMMNIINNNYQYFTNEDKSKLSSRLRVETVNKFELFSNGKVVDYKEMNENFILSNITNEAL